jgi:hypothetical protein
LRREDGETMEGARFVIRFKNPPLFSFLNFGSPLDCGKMSKIVLAYTMFTQLVGIPWEPLRSGGLR